MKTIAFPRKMSRVHDDNNKGKTTLNFKRPPKKNYFRGSTFYSYGRKYHEYK